MLFVVVLLALICGAHGRQERRKTIYSHADELAAPILATADERWCNSRCDYDYPGRSDTPYCCGKSDTTGTYFCCQ